MPANAHPAHTFVPFENTAIDQSIPACFEQQVAWYPDRPAVVSAELQFTYAELNQIANRIARAMINNPKVMILDEPFRGLDAMTKELMWEYYSRLYEENRRTNFFVTTDLRGVRSSVRNTPRYSSACALPVNASASRNHRRRPDSKQERRSPREYAQSRAIASQIDVPRRSPRC